MKQFGYKIVLFVFIISFILVGFDVLSFDENYSMPIARLADSDTYLTHMDGPDWIVPLIERVQERDDSHVLLIGDSVCRQMFIDIADINDEVCIAPAIAPFTMCGQYVLTKLYLESHPNATDVFLMVLPEKDFLSGIGTSLGYQFLVIPLIETDTLNLLDQSTIDEITNMFGAVFVKEAVVRIIDNSGVNRKLYLNGLKKYSKSGHFHSIDDSLYTVYLQKMVNICNEKGVIFHLLPPPMADTKELHDIVESYFPDNMEKIGLEMLIPEYMGNVRFYPEEMFSDGTHFGGVYEEQRVYNEIITEMYGDEGLIEKLVLDKAAELIM